jgi:hypothetical protein
VVVPTKPGNEQTHNHANEDCCLLAISPALKVRVIEVVVAQI